MADSCVAVLFTHVWVIAIYEHEHFTRRCCDALEVWYVRHSIAALSEIYC